MVNVKSTLEEALPENALENDASLGLDLFSWFSERITTKSGSKYKNVKTAITNALLDVEIPTILGSPDSFPYPITRSTVLAGEYRVNAYNTDHAGRNVNQASEAQIKDRSSGVDLVQALRYPCHIHTDGSCWVHPVELTCTCGVHWNGSTSPQLTGDVGTEFHNKYNSGMHLVKKTAYLAMSKHGAYLAGYKSPTRNSGSGRSGGFKEVAYRYVSTCDCGRKSCKGNASCPLGDLPCMYTVVNTKFHGAVCVILDPRNDDYNALVQHLGSQVGGVQNLVIERFPFSRSSLPAGGDN
jgi:hypothetical protein